MSETAIDATVAQMQHLLERDYAHLEWRVLVSPPPHGRDVGEPMIFVHARTRDFRSRCRVDRRWTTIAAGPTLEMQVAEIAAEVERALAPQGSS